MNSNVLHLSDKLSGQDLIKSGKNVFKRTRVIGGYDAYVDKNGVTRFGEKLFDQSNMIELGGALFVLRKLFNVESPLQVAYLEDIMEGIKRIDETELTALEKFNTDICLFGIGTGGCGEAMTDVKDVYFYEREIKDMIPFRQTEYTLTGEDTEKYWFKKNVVVNGSGKVAYYLKRFESNPTIKVLWKDGEDGEDGSEVQENVHETPEGNTTEIETFVEMTLKISKKDVREYFTDAGNIEQARVNSFGLFTGIKHKISEAPEEYDYRGVQLFSKLNINNEMLLLSKDLTIVYRIYLS